MKKIPILIAIVFCLSGFLPARAESIAVQHEQQSPAWDDRNEDPMTDFFSGWNPGLEMARMQQMMRKMEQLSASANMNAWPAATGSTAQFENLANQYRIQLHLPGMDKNKIDLTASDHQLRVSGERQIENQYRNDRSARIEKQVSYFEQILPIPNDADETGIKADYKKDILTIYFPKLKKSLEAKPERKVPVN